MSRSSETTLHPEIRNVLSRLRGRIRTYVFLQGTALVAMLAAALFWFSLGLDWAYFHVRSLELPVWFRRGFTIAAACLFVWSLGLWVLLRLSKQLRTKGLALVLERRFPELADRLITAVEWNEPDGTARSPLTTSMYDRTVDDAAAAVAGLDLSGVFDVAPLKRTTLTAILLVASVGFFAVTNLQAMQRWTRAYLAWDEEYWHRETELTVKVIAQPGDRIREFENDEYKHPRGADLTLLVEVAEGKQVPDQIELDYDLLGGHGGGRSFFSTVDDRRAQFTISGLLDSLEFRVRGGDFTNRRPLIVTVVDPPRVDQIDLLCDYPDYTGLDLTGEDGEPVPQNQPVRGSQISLPMETEFLMQVATNKPLVGVKIETSALTVTLSDSSASIRISADETSLRRDVSLPLDAARSMLEPGQTGFQLSFAVSAGAEQRLAEWNGELPIPLPPDSLLRIELEDTDKVLSVEPARLTINGIVDLPPTIETELRGISTAITRKAVVPVVGTISDDYGIVTSRFDFRVDDAEQWRARPFRSSPVTDPRQFRLQRSPTEDFEHFDVLPLDLANGQKLTLTVYARDGDNQNGPHSSQGEKYVFEIVSDEELLSILYGKELNLRRRFERIIEEVRNVRGDILLHRERAEDAKQLRSKIDRAGGDAQDREQLQTFDTAVAVCAERALHQVRKNAGETAAVSQAFDDVLLELVNNSVHTQKMADRIDGLIATPLKSISVNDFPAVDSTINDFRRANARSINPVPAIDQSVRSIDVLLEHMQTVLNEMEDLVKFHEAIQRLKTIIEEEQSISDETKQEQKRRLLNRLKGLNLD